ncbi:MAG: FG-GAP-like repeat-containing protein [Gemmataceae bacterium]|nr:FG-GAP-like repeat-containing protein [Gemmataceae bacterium]
MTKNKRRTMWLLAAGAALLASVMLVPGSPLYVVDRFIPKGQHGGRTADAWIQALASPDTKARQQAVFALGAIGGEGPDATPALIAVMLKDDHVESRQQAALALAKIAPAGRSPAPALAEGLAKALDDPDGSVRMNAALALSRMGQGARPAIPALLKAIADDANKTNLGMFHHTIQELAALALGKASAGNEAAVPALLAMLESADTSEQQAAAARALGGVGPKARAALPRLRVLLDDSNAHVRAAIAEAWPQIAGEKLAPRDPGADRKLELPEDERIYIWNIEHHGNLLGKHGFSQMGHALKNADQNALNRIMADDFRGADLRDPHRIRTANDTMQVERLLDRGQPPVILGRDAFAARLLEFRKLFGAQAPAVKFSLMNLGPQQHKQTDGPWVGTALLRMFGPREKNAPAEVSLIIRYEIPRPTEQRLAQPGWLQGAALLNVHVALSARPLFVETAKERGLDDAKLHDNWRESYFHAGTGGAFVSDCNRDGILDVLITDVNVVALYQGGPGGRFTDVTDAMGLPRHTGGNYLAAWADLDGDGWDDLILGDRLYRNEEGQRFADVGSRARWRLPPRAGNVIVADYDKDGKLDLYVTRVGQPGSKSWLDDKSGDARGNYLFRNLGDWQFENVTQAAGASGNRRSTFAAAWLDANDDGWPDLHVINEFGDGVLLVNNQKGAFTEQALASRPADYGSMGMAVGDVNNDGHIDIYCANMFSKAGTRVIGNLALDAFPPKVMEKVRRFVAGSQLHLNKGGLKFEQVGTAKQIAGVGWAYGACLADLDSDGWLDIYATAGYVSRSRDLPDG